MILSKNYGLYYTLISVFCAAFMVIIVKILADKTNIYNILFYRGFLGFIFIAIFLLKLNIKVLYTKKIHVHFVRSAINAFALYFWFNALLISSLADVSAIGNVAPIFATLLAILFLKEKFFLNRIIAILLGFFGVLLIIKPGFNNIETGYYMALAAAILWSFLVVFLKNLSKTENFFSVIFYFQLFLFIFIGLIFYNKIELPNLDTFMWIILMSILGNLSQIFYFQALKFKDVSFVTPFEYLRFIIIAFFGVVLFSEEPNISTYIGSIIIFIGLILISVERKILTKSYNFIFKN